MRTQDIAPALQVLYASARAFDTGGSKDLPAHLKAALREYAKAQSDKALGKRLARLTLQDGAEILRAHLLNGAAHETIKNGCDKSVSLADFNDALWHMCVLDTLMRKRNLYRWFSIPSAVLTPAVGREIREEIGPPLYLEFLGRLLRRDRED